MSYTIEKRSIFRQKRLQRIKAGKREGRHRACMFEKAKTSAWLKHRNYMRAVKCKTEKVGLDQTSEDLMKQTPYLQHEDRIKLLRIYLHEI